MITGVVFLKKKKLIKVSFFTEKEEDVVNTNLFQKVDKGKSLAAYSICLIDYETETPIVILDILNKENKRKVKTDQVTLDTIIQAAYVGAKMFNDKIKKEQAD